MYLDLGEIFFSVLITYVGAVELAFLAQNFVHWLFRHRTPENEESLEDLQRKVENEIKEAESKEVAGLNAMKDGVLYKDGFRVDSDFLANKTFRPDFVAELRKTLGEDGKNEIQRELIGASDEHANIDNESEKRELIGASDEHVNIDNESEKRELIGASEEHIAIDNESETREEVHEEPCIKKEVKRYSASPTPAENLISNNDNVEKHERTEESQPSQTEEVKEPLSSPIELNQVPELTFDEYQREEPEGQDSQGLKYSEEYLRSLDGIKHRPLVREDGTGRRRAFRKRLSIDSTSSRESRASREEELKMFTSLEEEEFEAIRKGETDYVPIRYTSEPTLKVKNHHKRHRKSPIKDSSRRFDDEDSRSSTDKGDEEEVNPWGDIQPEHYKDTEFWKREKAISIEEEDADVTLGAELPKASSFEEATDTQNEKALNALQQKESSQYEKEREKSPYDSRKSMEKNVSKDDVEDTLADGYPNAYDQPASHDTLKTPLKSDVYIEISETDNTLNTEQYFSTELQVPPERLSPRPPEVTVEVEPQDLMEGISDFYDFNASINPSRSKSRSVSRDRSAARSKSKSPFRPPSSHSIRSADRFPIVPIDAKGVEGVSDFYDYCVLLNRRSYSHSANGSTTHCSENSSVNLLLRDHDLNEGLKPAIIPASHSKNSIVQEEDTGGTLDLKTNASPTTPGSEISFVSVPSYVERMKDEYRTNAFLRSQYPGESMDLSDSYENLREEARHFCRSRSRSRSLGNEARKLTGQELQAKILEEISRTTIDYQDFSKHVNQTFIDQARRGSDSALLHKPEILIQIQDERENSYAEDEDGIMNILEADEYHHFRRFSLNQEYQVEEYPTDNYVYVEKVEVRNQGGVRHWPREDFYDGEQHPRVPLASFESTDESDRAEAEDLESGSDDERQTVVEVEDDILDNVRADTPNDDFPEEETKLFVEKYQWKDDEGVGENFEYSSNADIPIRSGTIQKTFRIDRNGDGEKFNTSRSPSKESSAALIDSERHMEAYMAASSTTSTTKFKRLRTRYGISTASLSYSNYEVGDRYSPETTQAKPKKEYNWRKNFKLDDDDEAPKTDKKLSFSVETKTEGAADPAKEGGADDYLDPRKMSLGGESITLFSRSPDRIKDFDFSGDNFAETFEELGEEDDANIDEEFQNMFEQQAIELEDNEGVPKVLNERLNRSIADEEVEINIRVGDVGGFLKGTQQEAMANMVIDQEASAESTRKSKKKKSKKKGTSVEDEDPEITNKDETSQKKKSKKKRRSAEKDEVTSQKSPSPPSKRGAETQQTNSPSEKKSLFNFKKPAASPSTSSVPQKATSPLPSTHPQKATSPLPSTHFQKAASPLPSSNPQKATSPLPRSEFNLSPQPQKATSPLPRSEFSASPQPQRATSPMPRSEFNPSPQPQKATSPLPRSEFNPSTSPKKTLERQESSGAYELIKDGSMYPWF